MPDASASATPQPDAHSPSSLALIDDSPPAETMEGLAVAADALRREQEALELAKARSLVDKLALENEQTRQNTEQRKEFANKLFWTTVVWLAFVGYVVAAQGFGRGIGDYGRFHLADSVLIALITTTTATVIGVFLVVVNYLFPRSDLNRFESRR